MDFGTEERDAWLASHSCDVCGNLGRDECSRRCRERREDDQRDRADERACDFAPFDWRR